MTDAPYHENVSPKPGPWGHEKLGAAGGLHTPEESPKLPNMATLAGRVSRMEVGGVIAFFTLLITFGGGYVLLAGQQAAATDRLASKLDAISTQLGDVKTDVAVLKERTPPTAKP